jgi:hypothetical protein
MSDHTTAPARPEPDPAVTGARRVALDEDWAATVVGLFLRLRERFPTFVLGFLLVGPGPATPLFHGFAAA